MGVYLNISPADKAYHLQLAKDHLELFERQCTITYTPIMVPCATCSADAIGQMPGNYWADGTAFNNMGNCPQCNGTHYIAQEATDNILARIEWAPKEFKILPGEVRKPYNLIKIRGKMEDAPKLMRAEKILIQLPVAPILNAEFKLDSELCDENGFFQGNFYSATLKRI